MKLKVWNIIIRRYVAISTNFQDRVIGFYSKRKSNQFGSFLSNLITSLTNGIVKPYSFIELKFPYGSIIYCNYRPMNFFHEFKRIELDNYFPQKQYHKYQGYWKIKLLFDYICTTWIDKPFKQFHWIGRNHEFSIYWWNKGWRYEILIIVILL
jgi:hypothetical protein